MKNAVPGFGLALSVTGWKATYVPSGGLFLFGSGVAASIDSQDLPFGLPDAEAPVQFSFTSLLVNPSQENSVLTGFSTSSAGQVTTALVPEPSTAGLFTAGLVGLAVVGSPRRRAPGR